VRRPYGLFLITGPTGSGKTRTGISILGELSRPEVNVLTVEDPVEYEIPGITQVQVNPQAGVKFADVLRAFLRQDPDIIMVGEIRDSETAKIATEAALTGHLVIATLHTNDAPSSATRLMDLGVDPANVSAALLGVLAQRLVRRPCPACSVERAPTEAELRGLHATAAELPMVRTGPGCPACSGTGCRGRTGVHELLEVDDDLRALISRRAPPGELAAHAATRGLASLREDGIAKIRAGQTTPAEIIALISEA